MVEASTAPLIIGAKPRDIAPGFQVRRVLPAAQQRSVGPFVFLDHMGPVTFAAGHGMDVGAHPHIGLCTLTYLFQGRAVHRDSVGSVQVIEPGDVNWMTAGRGISHSERTHDDDRAGPLKMHGLQFWVAMPEDREEDEPAFEHHGRDTLPAWNEDGAAFRLVAGSAYGRVSPVAVLSPMFLVHVDAPSGATVALPTGHEQAAAYVVTGGLVVDGTAVEAGTLVVLAPGTRVETTQVSTLAFIGGEALQKPRHMWWNFVSSRKERVATAREDWREGRIPLPPGESVAIPAPER